MKPEPLTWVVDPADAGQRLDTFVGERAERLSRSQAKLAVAAGQVTVNGRTAQPGQRLKTGWTVAYQGVEPTAIDVVAEPIALDVRYEDADLLVVCKPVGMVTHPARGAPAGTLVNALLAHCQDLSGIGGKLRPGIVHRLDRDTSGLMVVAKHDVAHRRLAAQLQARTAGRVYLALAWGRPGWDQLTVDAPLGRHPQRRLEIAVRDDGRAAVTHLTCLERFCAAALLRAELQTGRTHQVRVHCAHVGCPLLGDRTYGLRRAAALGPLPEPAGAALAALAGQALHAAELRFEHPADGRPMHFAAAPPAPFTALLATLRGLAAGA